MGVFGDGDAADPCGSRAGGHDTAEDAHGGAFAGSVGAEEADYFAWVDAEAYIVNCGEGAVLAGQIFNSYAGLSFHVFC